MQLHRFFYLLGLPVLMGVAGCASSTNAAFNTFKLLNPYSDPTANAVLDTRLEYLRVTANSKPMLMVLGYTEPSAAGDTQVWFSSGREVVRLRNGRLVGSAGTPVELKRVEQAGAPAWSAGLTTAMYSRSKDVMPAYEYGLKEHVRLEKLQAAAPKAWQQNRFVNYQPSDVVWFTESYQPLQSDDAATQALFGVVWQQQVARVVYSEQCLSADLCLTFQEWPAR